MLKFRQLVGLAGIKDVLSQFKPKKLEAEEF